MLLTLQAAPGCPRLPEDAPGYPWMPPIGYTRTHQDAPESSRTLPDAPGCPRIPLEIPPRYPSIPKEGPRGQRMPHGCPGMLPSISLNASNTPGCLCMPLHVPGHPRIPQDAPEYPLMPLNTPTDTPEYPRIPQDTQERRISQGAPGCPWMPQDVPGCFWVPIYTRGSP